MLCSNSLVSEMSEGCLCKAVKSNTGRLQVQVSLGYMMRSCLSVGGQRQSSEQEKRFHHSTQGPSPKLHSPSWEPLHHPLSVSPHTDPLHHLLSVSPLTGPSHHPLPVSPTHSSQQPPSCFYEYDFSILHIQRIMYVSIT